MTWREGQHKPNETGDMSTNKLPKQYFHLVFSLIMGAIMVLLMTFVITLVNVGMASDFFFRWMKAFAVAYVVAVPVIYFLAPMAKKLATRFADMP
jgi:hypothetical protein